MLEKRGRWLWFALGFELLLIVPAVGLAFLFRRPLLASLHPDWHDALIGALATAPLFLLFQALLRSPWRHFEGIRAFLENHLRPVFGRWTVGQLALVSLTAGCSEEVLFRGVLQGGLTQLLGPPLALVCASLLFGLCHLVTRPYGVLTAVIGLYLGGLWLLTGNLLAPITAHALYDFLALVYFLRFHRPSAS
jgi:membrane protease YdiL (CAAX protease family)